MGEGQYRVDDELRGQLNELDDRAVAAMEADDEPALDGVLDEMWELVRSRGERLPDDDLSASEVVIPPSDLTLEETKQLFSEDGLVPDLPAPCTARADSSTGTTSKPSETTRGTSGSPFGGLVERHAASK
jgi:hypothetical protein